MHESTFDDACEVQRLKASFVLCFGFQLHVQAQALPKGHSTARMAGAFAARLGAQRLLLTHFRCLLSLFCSQLLIVHLFPSPSARYMPRSKDEASMNLMEQQVEFLAGVTAWRRS